MCHIIESETILNTDLSREAFVCALDSLNAQCKCDVNVPSESGIFNSFYVNAFNLNFSNLLKKE